MTRVLVVDDHPVVLRGLASLIASDDGLTLVGAAGSAGEALALVEEPDVAVLDLHLPDGDGIDLGRMLKSRWPRLRVLILTMNADSNSVVRSLGAGLDGYVLKDADPEELLSAIHSAATGSLVLGSGASEAVVRATASAPRTDLLSVLDAREMEILALLVDGLSTSQVASRLYLARKTILNRVSDIVGKLAVDNRAEAIALGKAAGLQPSE
ncbi:response regulator [Ornithinimicrobium cryptoxanthini]|uniref:Response regulator transcription factor n=1 Tax=Ornithinimicrobium cryptoxanthini TaxID=2934161 RepID=A0ABY4YJ59_9MICO|nr:response regulator transcription factor [Ornithinimicrobium cryptoxanthini]USQ76809.1 response regulator transcription factor [Ornithinimicrobium cryptoxanthini]